MKKKFIGREQEIKLLEDYFTQSKPNLVVLRGRRRIGKSRMIDHFARQKCYYSFTGLPPETGITAEHQRLEFTRKLSDYFDLPRFQMDDWADVFSELAKQCKGKKAVVLFDEISWMAMKDPTFLGKLRNAWDREFKPTSEVMLILCGSISTWIEKNILSSTGYLGRVDYELELSELPLAKCMEFWPAEQRIADYEKFKYLAVTGGVPLYLEALNPKQTAEQNIQRLCFAKGGLLVREFKNIFTDLFGKKAPFCEKIVLLLSEGPLEQKILAEKLGVMSTGWFSERLQELEKASFVKKDSNWAFLTGEERRTGRYRLSDNYIRFYLKYIKKYLPNINKNRYVFSSITDLPGWKTILGLQAENFILNNRNALIEKLGINIQDVVNDGPYFQKQTAKQKACQIDYLIQDRHNTIYVIEIKFKQGLIKTSIIKEMAEKIDRLKLPRGYSCRAVLVHVNSVSVEVVSSGFFASIINFSDLAK